MILIENDQCHLEVHRPVHLFHDQLSAMTKINGRCLLNQLPRGEILRDQRYTQSQDHTPKNN
jgi:hypothetical protein